MSERSTGGDPQGEGVLGRLVRASAARPLVALAILSLGLVDGASSFGALPRDVFPDLATPVFNVIVQGPTMGTEEIERRVAVPLERALTGLPGLRRIRSVCQAGIVQTTVELDPDADYFRSRQLVGERVAVARGFFPEGVEAPLISGVSARLNEVMELIVEWVPEHELHGGDLLALRDFAEVELRNRLTAVPGVGGFDPLGGELRELSVRVDPARMNARHVGFDRIVSAARGATSLTSAGVIADGEIEWAVELDGAADSADALGRTAVGLEDGVAVRLADVADVVEAGSFRRGIGRHRGREVVHIRLIKQIGADAVSVSHGVHAALASLSVPPEMSVEVTYDQADLVEEALSGVGRAVGLGAIFVVLVIFLLLGDLRAAVVVAVGIPVSVILALSVLGRAGQGLNTMTLGGLAIAVGLLVDASIIVVENAAHRLSLRRGEPRLRVITDAAVEMARPITFATLVVMAVFVPLFGVPGVEGRMYGALSLSVVSAMGAALFVALLSTPSIASVVMRPPTSPEHDGWLIVQLKRLYAPMLAFCLRHPRLVQVGGVAITLPILWLGTQVGADFVPHLDEGYLMIETFGAPDATLATGDALAVGAETAAEEAEGVLDVTRRTGRGEGTEDPMLHTFSDILVRLDPERTRGDEEIASAIRERLRTSSPGLEALFTSPLQMRIDEGLGGTAADLSLRIFGPDLSVLARYAGLAEARLAATPGFADVRADVSAESPSISVHLNRDSLLRAGITPAFASETVQAALVGLPVATVFRGGRPVSVRVRALAPLDASPAALRELPIETGGGLVPLRRLADIEAHTAPSVIRREAGARRIAIEASVVGIDLGSAAVLARRIARDLDLPPGYFADVGGRIDSQEASTSALLFAVALALVLVLVLLYLAIGDLGETLTILLTLPSALVGGVVALLLTGETWNVSSLVGLLGLFGIAVQNGLVLVTQAEQQRHAGKSYGDALREACLGRVRPKLMTAATAILGLLPLVVLPLRGVELERPLAIVMIGGLVTSTLFTLLVLPTFLELYWTLSQRFARKEAA